MASNKPGLKFGPTTRGKRASATKPAPPSPRPHNDFATERSAYVRLKPDLLVTSLGRFVVLVGEEMLGPFDDFRSAYIAGRRRFGPGPLYIRQVLAEEQVFEPVGLEPCPS